ncbi:L-fucose/L-arabinose isomerase family protein [Moorella naiadis]|uniref:L-fucose/L-arabinose isomerase family protein n=1 Tax=Moorella naiadis (nom. illeg.) TaxID=3093670 RepID=UPI003D9C9F17
MSNSAKVGLVMLGRPFFDMPLANEFFTGVKKTLQEAGVAAEIIEEPVTVPEEAIAAARRLKETDVAAIIAVQGTFTDASLILNLTANIDLPLLIWAVKEEPTGERLRLNSFCGLNLGAHALTAAGKRFKGVYGNPGSPKVEQEVLAFIRAAGAAKWLKGKRIGLVGHRPAGYYTSNFNEVDLYSTLGVAVDYISLLEVFTLAGEMDLTGEPELTAGLVGYDQVDTGAAQKSLRAYLALKKIIADKSLDAVAVECWPDFMAAYGGAACFSLGQLNDDGIVAACEADVNGAVTMLLGQYWSGQATFLADLVIGEEEKNELTFWHCGAAPRSLMAATARALAGVHPNRKIPLSLYFPLREGKVTISRLSPDKNGKLRLLLGKGTGLQAPMLFSGNTLPVRLETPVGPALDAILNKGFEHHYVLTYGDFTPELREFARLLELEIVAI